MPVNSPRMLSVLIVNWNTKEMLRACLASLRAHPPREPMEVIVVDNASTDGSADMVAQEFPEFKLIASDKNLGFAEGNNLAYRHATAPEPLPPTPLPSQGAGEGGSDWILTLNPDTELVDDSLQKAIDILSANPDHAALGARQISPDGSTQCSVRGFPSFLGILGDITGLSKKFPRSAFGSYRLPAFDYDQEQDAPQPMATFLLLRREALAPLSCAAPAVEERGVGGRGSGNDVGNEISIKPQAPGTSPLTPLQDKPLDPGDRTPPPQFAGAHSSSPAPTGVGAGEETGPEPLPPAPLPSQGAGEGEATLFDPQFPIFFNEVDLLYRLKQKGWRTLYAPNVKILHHGGESTKQVKKSMIWESHRSLVRFLRKHYGTLWQAPLLGLLTLIIYAGAWIRAKGYHRGFRT